MQAHVNPMTQHIRKASSGFVGRCSCDWSTWRFEDHDIVVMALEMHVRGGHRNGNPRLIERAS